jgi:hypothetical protein
VQQAKHALPGNLSEPLPGNLKMLHQQLMDTNALSNATTATKELHSAVSKLGKVRGSRIRTALLH